MRKLTDDTIRLFHKPIKLENSMLNPLAHLSRSLRQSLACIYLHGFQLSLLAAFLGFTNLNYSPASGLFFVFINCYR